MGIHEAQVQEVRRWAVERALTTGSTVRNGFDHVDPDKVVKLAKKLEEYVLGKPEPE